MPERAAHTDLAAQTSLVAVQPQLAVDQPVRRDFLLAVAAAVLLRLFLAPWVSYRGDMATFISWGVRMAEVGPGHFYGPGCWCDYLPGYLYVLWPLGVIARHLSMYVNCFLFKLPNMAADVVTALLLWRTLGRTPGANRWLPIIYLFNPAVLVNSTIWGQADSFHAMWLVGGLTLLAENRVLPASLALAYAAAIKPHGIIILPLAAVYALCRRVHPLRLLLAAVVLAATFAVLCLPFTNWSLSQVPDFVAARVGTTMEQYGYASVNALNFWYLLGYNWRPDSTVLFAGCTVRTVGTILFSICYVLALVWVWRRTRRVGAAAIWEAAALVYLATFLFVTRAHERHLFPFLPMMTAAAATQVLALVPLALASLVYVINLALAWAYAGHRSAYLCPATLGAALCAVNLAIGPLAAAAFTGRGRGLLARLRQLAFAGPPGDLSAAPAGSSGPSRKWLALIILFALVLRVGRLNAPPQRYFDEVYHAYTAQQWVAGSMAPWLWNTRAPDKDCAYEWTHPPTAKLMMAAALRICGVHPWTWRLPAALLGTLNVLLIYLIARRLFAAESVALLAAACAALDALPLVLSRIGMNDTYMIFFMLASVLAALHDRFVLSALAAGLALSCKWSALYNLPLLALIYTLRATWTARGLTRMALVGALHALLIPAIYLASYTPFFRADFGKQEPRRPVGRWNQFVELQKQMWWYHMRLKAKHPYSSPAYLWPVNGRPIWLHTATAGRTAEGVEIKTNVYATGNPVIWLPGVGALLFGAWQGLRNRNASWLIVLGGWLFFWAPWLSSPRIMFIYHYLPSLPFLYIALAAAVVQSGVRRAGVITLLVTAAVVLLAMYPYLTAVPLPINFTPGHWGRT